jgi:hypothetical protein
MRQVGVDQRLKLRHEALHPVRREVEPEQLHCNELVLVRIVGTEDGTERASSDLMKNAKWTERVGMRGASSFRVQ